MKQHYKPVIALLILLIAVSVPAAAQFSFINADDQLQGVTHSGCSVAVTDINGDGLDDLVRLEEGHILYIDYQISGKKFSHNLIGDFGNNSGWAWGMCVGDFDHNGFKDVVAGGGGPAVRIMMIDDTGLSGSVTSMPNSGFFVQNINVMDVNNDGWEDLFACDDDAESHIWTNNGDGTLSASSIIDFDVTNTDDSGNYGSVWTDFDNDGDVDFYIAKCRQFVNNPADGRRIDVLFVNNGDGTYTSAASQYTLADSGQTWTCNFGDIDNDGDLDAIQVDYDIPVKLLENDGTGHMTNIASGSGFNISIYPIESVMEDFDNDGFIDILVTGTTYQLFHNNGNHTFTEITDVFGSGKMESFAIGDLNHDGRVDIYASYAQIYTTPTSVDDVFWLNNSNNGNHFITFNLVGSTATPASYGARVTLYGSWGKQVREVHAGESYGTCNSTSLHFGLGTATTIDSAVVYWPSGTTKTILNPKPDQFVTVVENSCVSPDFSISASGSTVFCPGSSVTLTAASLPLGYSYLWSDSSTGQSISVADGGNYYCKAVSSNDACSVTSVPISVVVNPPSIPTVTVSGDLTFCQGGSVTLTSSAADSYTWSTGETTQSIEATESGDYFVAVPGMCQDWPSVPVTVNMLASPAPVTTDVTIGAPQEVTLTAEGTDIYWYDVPAGGSPIGFGDTYTTFAYGGEVYYAEDRKLFAGDTLQGGQFKHTGSSNYSGNTTNNYLIFDVYKNCTLSSVKVYTDEPGMRIITLRDHNGTLINSVSADIPTDSSRVTLNFALEPGNGYQLGTDTAQNILLLGYNSPRLSRSSSGVDYPYVTGDLLSINNSQAGSDYYYYFYDWEVHTPSVECISDRSPATIQVATGNTVMTDDAAFEIFPNPSNGLLTLTNLAEMEGKVTLSVLDVAGRELFSESRDGLVSGVVMKLDLTGFAKGIYCLQLRNNESTRQQKLVIE